MRPYYEDESVKLFHGDCREFVAPPSAMTLADPPYGQTSLEWDRWPFGWVDGVVGDSLWCFGSLKMFMSYAGEFQRWRLAQDVIWEKQNGSSFHADRFRRVHEQPAHFYRGDWESIYKDVVTTADAVKKQVRRKRRPPHMGHIDAGSYESHDGGPRMMRSVIYARNCHGFAEHPTQKPFEILQPLIEYSCPPGGTVYVPFAGSGSELEAARQLGRKAVGVEIREECCEVAARRLQQRRARQWQLELGKADAAS
jgi:site-specific DNA-methyltransferase (adenine-specific)